MSRPDTGFDLSELPAPICDLCGFPITDDEQRCAARDDGRCLP